MRRRLPLPPPVPEMSPDDKKDALWAERRMLESYLGPGGQRAMKRRVAEINAAIKRLRGSMEGDEADDE